MHSDKKRWGLGFVSAMGLALSLMPTGSGCGTLETEDPPLVRFDEPTAAEEVAPNQYIFAYHEGATESEISATEKLFADLGGVKHHDFRPFFNGFSGELPPEGLKVMLRNPALSSIHPNGVVHATGLQTCPSWGLDVLDQANSIEPNGVYTYTGTGTGVHVYVLDSGIYKDHDEFFRLDGTSRVGNGQCKLAGGCANSDDWNDCQGHGTHLAGVAGGKTYGVAKDVTLHAVRVLKCDANCGEPSGLEADVLAGLNWINTQVVNAPGQKAVVVMGFSRPNPGWTSLYNALNNAGLPFAVVAAAGNDGGIACQNMPGGRPNGAMLAKNVLTVGAFDNDGNVTSFSNQGGCVDVFAPGIAIPGPLSPVCSAKLVDTRWGTSAAAAHAAGVAALMLESGVAPGGIRGAIVAQAHSYGLGNLNANSPALVLRAPNTNIQLTSPESASSTIVDADGCNDGALCSGGACLLCDALPAQCQGLTTGGGVTCNTLGECDVCGDEGLACCPGAAGSFCASGFSCVGGTCTCGGPGQACCGGIGGLCDDPFACDSKGFCGPCGDKDQVCCDGGCNGDDLSCHNDVCVQCGTEGQSCCSGDCYGTNLVCDNGQCKKCGLDGQPCCDGGCNGTDLACNNGTCSLCGTNGAPCCEDGCVSEDLFCNAQNQCVPCGTLDTPCCDGDLCSVGAVCDGNICKACGTANTPCCDDGCVSDELVCNVQNQCVACGGDMQACCDGDECNLGNGCFNGTCKTCGGPGQECCPDYECSGDMGCTYKPAQMKFICGSTCGARCRDGYLAIPAASLSFPDEPSCTIWAQNACQGHGDAARITYNDLFVKNENCGAAVGEACCLDFPNCENNLKCVSHKPFTKSNIDFGGQVIGIYVGDQDCR